MRRENAEGKASNRRSNLTDLMPSIPMFQLRRSVGNPVAVADRLWERSRTRTAHGTCPTAFWRSGGVSTRRWRFSAVPSRCGKFCGKWGKGIGGNAYSDKPSNEWTRRRRQATFSLYRKQRHNLTQQIPRRRHQSRRHRETLSRPHRVNRHLQKQMVGTRLVHKAMTKDRVPFDTEQ